MSETPSERSEPRFDAEGIAQAVREVRRPVSIVRDASGRTGVVFGEVEGARGAGWLGTLPAIYPEWLGDRGFLDAHGVRFAYVAGAMANGIATAELVVAMARAKMLGFYGAAGQLPDRVARALDTIEREVPGASFGANLIHSPNEPALEEAIVEL
ncbi:MAG: 2-nitropropane dioxygenase, partial [Sandaracinaceae bacterium]|nr:2-nitropropane dioxygenase [Sandaracinaceae bacterium]